MADERHLVADGKHWNMTGVGGGCDDMTKTLPFLEQAGSTLTPLDMQGFSQHPPQA